MKIFRAEVIRDNLAFITAFVKNIQQGDDDATLDKRVAGSVTVTPEGSLPNDAGESEIVTVVFKTNWLVVVSHKPSIETLLSLLNQLSGQAGSLGLGMHGPQQAISNIGDASIAVLKAIMAQSDLADTIPIHIPVHMPTSATPPKLQLTGTASGWTDTTDTNLISNVEYADLTYFVRIDPTAGNKVVTTNEGKKDYIPIDSSGSVVAVSVNGPSIQPTYMELQYKLSTDGAPFCDTLSSILTKEIVMTYKYVKP